MKRIIIGDDRDPFDSNIFHKLSLIALFAWVGLTMSSASYGQVGINIERDLFRIIPMNCPRFKQ